MFYTKFYQFRVGTREIMLHQLPALRIIENTYSFPHLKFTMCSTVPNMFTDHHYKLENR